MASLSASQSASSASSSSSSSPSSSSSQSYPWPSHVIPVLPTHTFSVPSLTAFLLKHLQALPSLLSSSPNKSIEYRQFSHGQSNPTYLLCIGPLTRPSFYVLRKKPKGTLLPSAHQIDREYKILSSLYSSTVPVPQPVIYCDDRTVIGEEFYIMEYVEGRIFKDVELKGEPHVKGKGTGMKFSRGDRFAIYSSMNRILSNIHNIDIDQVGLSTYGPRPTGPRDTYSQRQIKRWHEQYEKSRTEDIAEMTELYGHLSEYRVDPVDSMKTTLVHGDYRLDNLIYHPKDNRIIGVLDWELSTLGHPTADLAYNCMVYMIEKGRKPIAGLVGLDFEREGIPTIKEYCDAYVRHSQREGSLKDFNFYLSLSFYRSASIAQGVYKRSLQGNNSNQMAPLFKQMVKESALLGIKALSLVHINSIDLYKKSMRVEASLYPFQFSPRFWDLRAKLLYFMDEYIYPNESTYHHQHAQLTKEKGTQWVIPPILDELKKKARELGLWNLFLTKSKTHQRDNDKDLLTNLEYAPLCEITGRSLFLAPTVTNCISAGTPVNLANGTYKAIEDVLVGDVVLSRGILNGKEGLLPRTVTHLLNQGRRDCVELLFKDGRTLVCTPDHRILTPEGAWVPASDLIVATQTVKGSQVTVGIECPCHVRPGAVRRAMARTPSLLPFFETVLVSRRAVGTRSVFDITVDADDDDFASFTANGLVVHNCAAPDTGNMEVLANYGTPSQQEQWLVPLLNGEIRSCFGMTEPAVASSDATNIECKMERVGDKYVINGRKWWTSGALDPACKLCILMVKTNPKGPKHQQQSMVLVDLSTKGVKILRHLSVFGYDDSPHGHAEVLFKNVEIPLDSILLGEGRGFEIAQGRLGPGRIHHAMRTIGMAERALDVMKRRVITREAFGRALATQGTIIKDIADSRIEIEQCRLLVLQAASMMDTVGNKVAQQQIAMIKVSAPHMALRVIDRAIQACGAQGVSGDVELASMWAQVRTLRLADGPDEVHRGTIAKLELGKAKL